MEQLQIITCALLPIELSRFSVENKEESVLLNWETKSETDNDYFVILRSNNGIDFAEIGEVNGMGNSSSTVNYQFVDERPYYGTSYYKLQQIDYDGEASFSQIISTDFNLNEAFLLYPNPTNANVNILISTDNSSEILIKIVDVFGKIILTQSQNLTNGTNSIPLSSDNFKAGMYFCKVTFPNGSQLKQTFVKYN